jgi:hypothetical protein
VDWVCVVESPTSLVISDLISSLENESRNRQAVGHSR